MNPIPANRPYTIENRCMPWSFSTAYSGFFHNSGLWADLCHLIAEPFYRFLQNLVRDLRAVGNHSGFLLEVDLAGNILQSVQGVCHSDLAVFAVHSFDRHHLFADLRRSQGFPVTNGVAAAARYSPEAMLFTIWNRRSRVIVIADNIV